MTHLAIRYDGSDYIEWAFFARPMVFERAVFSDFSDGGLIVSPSRILQFSDPVGIAGIQGF